MTPESFIADLNDRIPDLAKEVAENREVVLIRLFEKFLLERDRDIRLAAEEHYRNMFDRLAQ